jgi:hypothetical protein
MGGWMGSSFGGQMAFMNKDDGRHGGLQTKLGKRGFQSVSFSCEYGAGPWRSSCTVRRWEGRDVGCHRF